MRRKIPLSRRIPKKETLPILWGWSFWRAESEVDEWVGGWWWGTGVKEWRVVQHIAAVVALRSVDGFIVLFGGLVCLIDLMMG